MPLLSDGSSVGSSDDDDDDGIDYGAYLETPEELDTEPLWPSSVGVSQEAMREAFASVDLIAHGPRKVVPVQPPLNVDRGIAWEVAQAVRHGGKGVLASGTRRFGEPTGLAPAHDTDVPGNPRASILTRVRTTRAGRAIFTSTSGRSAIARPITADIDFTTSAAAAAGALASPGAVLFGDGPRFPPPPERPYGDHVGPGSYAPDLHPEWRPAAANRAAAKMRALQERFAHSDDPVVLDAVAEMEAAARRGGGGGLSPPPQPEDAAAVARTRTASFAVRRRRRAEMRAAERAAAAAAASVAAAAAAAASASPTTGCRSGGYVDPVPDPFAKHSRAAHFGRGRGHEPLEGPAREEQRLMATGGALVASDAAWLARGRTFGGLGVPRRAFHVRPGGELTYTDAGTKMTLATSVARSPQRHAATFRSAAPRGERDTRPTAGGALGPGAYDPEASLERLETPSCGRDPRASAFRLSHNSPARIDSRAMGDGYATLKPRRCPEAIPPRVLDRPELTVTPTVELVASGVLRPATSSTATAPSGSRRGGGTAAGGRRRPALLPKPKPEVRLVEPAATPGHRVPIKELFEAQRLRDREAAKARALADWGSEGSYEYGATPHS